jgi:hypothetical protein
MAVCAELGLDLSQGFLSTRQHHKVASRTSSTTMHAHLHLYLKEASVDTGETLHSFKAGAAITLALSGVQLSDVMSHIGWRDPSTASYYLKLAQPLTLYSSLS